jgi:hypothetical protein
MPYALVTTTERVFAGLSDGEIWESADRGDSWLACTLTGDALHSLVALTAAGR